MNVNSIDTAYKVPLSLPDRGDVEQSGGGEAAVQTTANTFARRDTLSSQQAGYAAASGRFSDRLVDARKAVAECSAHQASAAEEELAGSQDAREQVLKKHRGMSESFAGRLCQSTLAHSSAQAFAAMIKPSPAAEEQQMFGKFVTDTQNQLRSLNDAPPGAQGSLTPNGTEDFFDQLLEMIGFIKSDYLANYEYLIEQYSAFYSDFNKEIMAAMGDFITSKNDGKEVAISGKLKDALDQLISKYSSAPAGQLFPPANSSQDVTREQADNWAKAMGLDPATAVQLVNNKYVVMMDIAPLTTMRQNLVDMGMTGSPAKEVTVDSAKFQAWQTGFNSQESELKNQLSVFTTKYSNANSYYENFNKILSSQLSQYAELLKAYLSGF
ncbi:hypothetical protein PS865_04439 [Pseudomonas fluorescens]|uniref:IpaD/SipD/SspD family type III secretion system needle tip protein n=1 Tax=Pseudomonas fluorescens TaxID=294 RepID=UPI00123FE14E|nr:IpaD/SipD/SspD family type III secretion system needle tip protein [Pseudomonas fluorescens]VVP32567.1 hypothetical protein PS865_04439 [Pseudomonas fluorescens]